MMRLIRLLWHYWRARRLRFDRRAALQAHQARRLRRFLARLAERSRYFAPFRGQPLERWPAMDKATMLAHFDTMNTAGLTLADAVALAMRAEQQRDFTPTLNGVTVGLSSGTTAQRGVFAVSEHERMRWAGILLARMLPDGLFAGERVAFFLRANSNLYTSVATRWLMFEYFDLFAPMAVHLDRLRAYRPTIVVAPAQVLGHLANEALAGRLAIVPKRVISVAEVLEPRDRERITQAFGMPHEIYQATEGFLASTCAHGVLHLNEEYLHVEPEWLDGTHTRFVPIVTDFSRFTQPIVRYRLNDVLVARRAPCPCGRAAMALERIEGRCDDLLALPARDGTPLTVFADTVTRALAQALPVTADYRLEQTGAISLALHADVSPDTLVAVQTHLCDALRALGVAVERLRWTLSDQLAPAGPAVKRRRIVGLRARRPGECADA